MGEGRDDTSDANAFLRTVREIEEAGWLLVNDYVEDPDDLLANRLRTALGKLAEIREAGGVSRLTREQAAIIGLYTGALCGPYHDVRHYAEELAGHSLPNELGTRFGLGEELYEKLRKRALTDFVAIAAKEGE